LTIKNILVILLILVTILEICTDFFIEKLNSSQVKTGYVNTKSGFYVCNNKNQIPVIYNIHASYRLEGCRFKTSADHNEIEIISCSANRNNGYFTIESEKPK